MLRHLTTALSTGFSDFMHSRTWLIACIAATLIAFAIKLWLAWTTLGAGDISVWTSFLSHIKECGSCVYDTGGFMQYPDGTRRLNPFNHPPFIIHYLRFIDFVAGVTLLPFRSVLRALTSVFDIGSVVILYKLLKNRNLPVSRLLLYIAAPATIIVSGHHGNTDTLMILFVLLTALLLESGSKWAGLAFGFALCIKIVPIIFAAVFLFYLSDSRSRVRFLGLAALTGIVLSLPYILIEPITIIREVMGYSGFAGRWGFSRVFFVAFGPASNVFAVYVRLAAYLLLGYIIWMSYKHRGKDLMLQMGLAVFLFISFSPAWGSNYMAWLDPFPIFLGVWPALIYYLSSGALMVYLYFINDDESSRLMGWCWAAVLIVTWQFLRRVAKNGQRTI